MTELILESDCHFVGLLPILAHPLSVVPIWLQNVTPKDEVNITVK